MRRELFFAVLLAAGLTPGCGDDDGGGGAGGGSSEAAQDGTPAAFAGMRTHQDLLELVHLADVDHHGLFIDFGTPAHAKYTVGDWRSGWGSDGADGDTTFTNVGRRGRIYFQVDEPSAMTVRIRLRKVGTRALSPYINNTQLPAVFLQDEAGFQDVDFTLPRDNVQVGENYLLLTFGGVADVGGEEVAVAIDSIRVVPGEIAAGEYDAPTLQSLVSTVSLGGQERPAMVARRPTTFSQYVMVPQGAKLGFGVGFEGQGAAPVKVLVTTDGAPGAEVFSGSASGSWSDHAVDLSGYAGKTVRIEWIADGEGAGRVAWSLPRILVPAPRDSGDARHAKNVVVLLIDTLRADKLRPWNPRSRVRTPVIDGLATEGVVFQNALSVENWTKPSVASVLTGLHPTTHGANRTESRLPAGATLISEHLKENGFRTGSFIANGYVSDRFGFDQGWDHYTNYIREGKSTEAETVFGEAADWIEQNKDRRFFTYIQTIDPHVPYDPPDEYVREYDAREYSGQVRPRMTADLLEAAKRGEITFDASDRRRLEALHDGEITQHDHFLGAFIERLKAMGVWEDTLLVITSDHGEEFDDHGSWGHGHSVYHELLHVPLYFRLPGRLPAGRVEDVVSTMDIVSTVNDLLGVPRLGADEGRSLVGFMTGAPPPGPAVAFSYFHDERRVITTRTHKFLVRGNLTATLFDMVADPGERQQMDDGSQQAIALRFARVHLGQLLASTDHRSWISANQGQGTRLGSEQAEMDDAIRGQLRALGYAN